MIRLELGFIGILVSSFFSRVRFVEGGYGGACFAGLLWVFCELG